mmetsp:Transcript_12218/g.26843  ORF Transcript_12218/g.26843 Transcript_12218/m.26843 type:complete len:203 (-) Transcript_12218:276-884(-)
MSFPDCAQSLATVMAAAASAALAAEELGNGSSSFVNIHTRSLERPSFPCPNAWLQRHRADFKGQGPFTPTPVPTPAPCGGACLFSLSPSSTSLCSARMRSAEGGSRESTSITPSGAGLGRSMPVPVPVSMRPVPVSSLASASPSSVDCTPNRMMPTWLRGFSMIFIFIMSRAICMQWTTWYCPLELSVYIGLRASIRKIVRS